ncbi:hypothetical protein F4782DRAFT_544242 [Xylaria castorea]|nr:hypothetical protein F4782DRAFT_544242 [Xylaria castorea]
MANQNFRVIIVGAGPNGLYLAHALTLAHINFAVLEQGMSIGHQRAGLILWPYSARLLDQLGLYGHVRQLSSALHSKTEIQADSRILAKYPIHGYPMLPLPRNDLLNVLYQQLPSKDIAIKLGAEVVDYKVSDHGVCMHLKDDKTVEGSIVVGANRVHSGVRKAMEMMQQKDIPRALETPITANYKSIYAIGPNKRGIGDSLFIEIRGSGVAANLVTSPAQLLAIFYRRLPTPTSTRTQYTVEKLDSFAESFMDFTVAPGILFRNIWGDFNKASARLVNQEEVLLSNSAHKITSASGLGVHVGLHSAALLASELQKCLSSTPAPNTNVLKQDQRFRAKECQRLSTWSYWIFDRFISRLISMDKVLVASIYPIVSNGQILSYVAFEGKSTIVP